MHANYYRFGGVHQDLPRGLDERIAAWMDQFVPILDGDIYAKIDRN